MDVVCIENERWNMDRNANKGEHDAFEWEDTNENGVTDKDL